MKRIVECCILTSLPMISCSPQSPPNLPLPLSTLFIPLSAASGVPTNFSVTAYNDTTLRVSLSPPSERNGVLQLFQIEYQLFPMGSEVETMNVTVDEQNSVYEILLSDLSAFTMYSIRVRAATGAGFGLFTDPIIFSTLEAGKYMCVHVCLCVHACVFVCNCVKLTRMTAEDGRSWLDSLYNSYACTHAHT